MKGFFSIEILLVVFLLSYFFFIVDFQTPKVLRETEIYTQDLAQILMYGFSTEDIPISVFTYWVDNTQYNECEFDFRYCTSRFFEGREHRICAAACLQ